MIRDEPMFHTYYQVLDSLMSLDNALTGWRYAHINMVQKVIGFRHGTGGSSGYYYLRSTLRDNYKIFSDLADIVSYLVPRNRMPELSLFIIKDHHHDPTKITKKPFPKLMLDPSVDP
jgi:tryptophan 2,3-dioxygenase